VAGSTGSIDTATERWPCIAGTASSPSTRLTCPSLVENAPSREPEASSSTSKRSEAGALLLAARSGGGFTHR